MGHLVGPSPVARGSAVSCSYSTACHTSTRATWTKRTRSLANPRAGHGHVCAASSAVASPSEQTAQPQTDSTASFNRLLCQDERYAETSYLTGRANIVAKHFPKVLGMDDFVARMEIALFAYGFSGENSIAMSNLCRDEITATLKLKLDSVFGSSFNTNGLGGVLTCGVTGMGAGLSHSPVSAGSGKERYVFFSFPHVSVDATGEVGAISRPGRPGTTCACGALMKALGDIKRDGLSQSTRKPGRHEPLDPEYTILKQRLARRMRHEGFDEKRVQSMDLVEITKVAERTITDDLEYLIRHTVDHTHADYAVVTGILVHSWGKAFDDGTPNLEFVVPCSVYTVVHGVQTFLDLSAIPALTPRQINLVSRSSGAIESGDLAQPVTEVEVCASAGGYTTLREIDAPYVYNSRETRRARRARARTYLEMLEQDGLEVPASQSWPSWPTRIRANGPQRPPADSSVVIDERAIASENGSGNGAAQLGALQDPSRVFTTFEDSNEDF